MYPSIFTKSFGFVVPQQSLSPLPQSQPLESAEWTSRTVELKELCYQDEFYKGSQEQSMYLVWTENSRIKNFGMPLGWGTEKPLIGVGKGEKWFVARHPEVRSSDSGMIST